VAVFDAGSLKGASERARYRGIVFEWEKFAVEPDWQRTQRVCGELLILAENTSVAQSCESFSYR
jgi:hypothetical protein